MHTGTSNQDNHNTLSRFEVATEVALSAGAIALEYYRRAATLVVEHKGSQDLVSEADRETEHHIRSQILARFPEDSFMGEEHGLTEGSDGSGTWVVDPIDGTQPFLLGLPTWCVSIAYVADSRVEIGVIYNPATNELFTAGSGRGAFLNGEPIRVREAHALSDGLTGVGCSPKTAPEHLADPEQPPRVVAAIRLRPAPVQRSPPRTALEDQHAHAALGEARRDDRAAEARSHHDDVVSHPPLRERALDTDGGMPTADPSSGAIGARPASRYPARVMGDASVTALPRRRDRSRCTLEERRR